MALSATIRSTSEEDSTSVEGTILRLSDEDYKHSIVKKRIEATKNLPLIPIEDEKGSNLPDKIVNCVLEYKDSSKAILVFARSVEDVEKIVKKLPKDATQQLTGTLRGLERDDLVKTPVFQRFLPKSNRDTDVTPAEGTVYLVCTSAGDAMVRCSELQQELHDAFKSILAGDAVPMAKISPTSLVFGVWDSRDTQAKLPRLVSSTIRAFNVRELTRGAVYIPPVNYSELELFTEKEKEKAEGDKKSPLAKRGFVHVPASGVPGGVLADGGIRRDATLQLAA